MKPIYVPKGKAKEYGDYAINIYTGCPHECFYCFAPNVLRKDKDNFHKCIEPRKNILEQKADHLLDNGVIVPPCKVGAEVFYVHEICDEYLDISKGEVISFSLQKEGLWVYCRYEDGLTYWHLVEEFGIELFLTREEAEAKLGGESDA